MRCPLLLLVSLALASPAAAQVEVDLKKLLSRNGLSSGQTLAELQAFIEPRIPEVPKVADAREWERYAGLLRRDVLAQVVYRGEAATWRDAPAKVDWQETLPGGPGYRLRKLRFEALPGLWIPALL